MSYYAHILPAHCSSVLLRLKLCQYNLHRLRLCSFNITQETTNLAHMQSMQHLFLTLTLLCISLWLLHSSPVGLVEIWRAFQILEPLAKILHMTNSGNWANKISMIVYPPTESIYLSVYTNCSNLDYNWIALWFFNCRAEQVDVETFVKDRGLSENECVADDEESW